jgi:hypothetical protein
MVTFGYISWLHLHGALKIEAACFYRIVFTCQKAVFTVITVGRTSPSQRCDCANAKRGAQSRPWPSWRLNCNWAVRIVCVMACTVSVWGQFWTRRRLFLHKLPTHLPDYVVLSPKGLHRHDSLKSYKQNNLWVKNWRECGRKRPWCMLRSYAAWIHLYNVLHAVY